MSSNTPRCVYCSKPTRSHEVVIGPAAYADAYDDRTFDADHGTYHAAICHGCWAARDESALRELAATPTAGGADGTAAGQRGGGDGRHRLSPAAQQAIRDMQHEHVRFELAN